MKPDKNHAPPGGGDATKEVEDSSWRDGRTSRELEAELARQKDCEVCTLCVIC